MVFHANEHVFPPVRLKTTMATVGVTIMLVTSLMYIAKHVNVNKDIFFLTTPAQSVLQTRTVLGVLKKMFRVGEIRCQMPGPSMQVSVTVLTGFRKTRQRHRVYGAECVQNVTNPSPIHVLKPNNVSRDQLTNLLDAKQAHIGFHKTHSILVEFSSMDKKVRSYIRILSGNPTIQYTVSSRVYSDFMARTQSHILQITGFLSHLEFICPRAHVFSRLNVSSVDNMKMSCILDTPRVTHVGYVVGSIVA